VATENPPDLADGSTPTGKATERVCPACTYHSEVASEQFCPRDGAFLVDPLDLHQAENDPLLGRRISEFAIVARIGTGGMGTVYRAIQIGMDRQVALKVLRADLTDDPKVLQRFLQEAKATARLQHRNLAITYTSGSTSEGLFYIAMEYISGGSLTQLIEKSWVPGENGPTYSLEIGRTLRLFSQITAALAHAHRLGIVHRDLKPDNVLLHYDDDEGEQAKIVDFGIAKILFSPDGKSGLVKTDAHANLGTALYMAPERFAGAPGDPRLDVYALGLLLHELLTGLLPFATRYEDRDTPTVLLHKRLTSAVPAPVTSRPLSTQLLALHADLLDRDPLRRPAHAGEVRQRLREVPEAAMLMRISMEIPLRPIVPSGTSMPESAASRSSTPVIEMEAGLPAPAGRSIPPGFGDPLLAAAARFGPPVPLAPILPPLPAPLPLNLSPPLPGALVPPPAAAPLPVPLPPSSNSLKSKLKNSSTVTRALLAGCVFLALLLILLALS
jgi:serine/threonine protein kinase